MRLKDKVAVITGGGSGIGRATAIRFAKEGAKIVIADINEVTGEETLGEIKEQNQEAIFVKTNVAESKSIQNLMKRAVEHFGRIDILFNNAGIGNSEVRSVDLAEEEWDQVIDINLKSVFLGIKYAIPELKKSGNGVIINTASLLGLKGRKYVSAYNASKGGVVLLTQNAALEYGKYNIRVNAIAPGIIDTNIIKEWKNDERKWPILSRANALGRIGTPDEIASAALFLASDEASFVTGATLSVDGGGLIF
ncbi:glucose 1-dehydrogenase [Gottfriedia acidiceleris]|uniref:SDR family NAD(P)-dependent oxidoreductase n=1 Tax=Bacillaceae TaxID=186817 RepID=UPI000BEC88B2|nr:MULTISPECIES: glucose 1-dehydrogenase [unclassified Bacillus (in: firmicutes)]PEC48861.1 short-chain dehydrogenase [Bacillus sp. AFS096315]PFM82881.1 short-chain dehydrogenase [Bacillus sp. AFS077874]